MTSPPLQPSFVRERHVRPHRLPRSPTTYDSHAHGDIGPYVVFVLKACCHLYSAIEVHVCNERYYGSCDIT